MSKITKTKIQLGDSFQKETHRIHLKRLFPFLSQEFRQLNKSELNKLEVLHELFGSKETDLEKLKVLFNYQSI